MEGDARYGQLNLTGVRDGWVAPVLVSLGDGERHQPLQVSTGLSKDVLAGALEVKVVTVEGVVVWVTLSPTNAIVEGDTHRLAIFNLALLLLTTAVAHTWIWVVASHFFLADQTMRSIWAGVGFTTQALPRVTYTCCCTVIFKNLLSRLIRSPVVIAATFFVGSAALAIVEVAIVTAAAFHTGTGALHEGQEARAGLGAGVHTRRIMGVGWAMQLGTEGGRSPGLDLHASLMAVESIHRYTDTRHLITAF